MWLYQRQWLFIGSDPDSDGSAGPVCSPALQSSYADHRTALWYSLPSSHVKTYRMTMNNNT